MSIDTIFEIGFLLTIVFLSYWWRVLFRRVVALRRSKKIFIGFGNDEELHRSIRCHANFVENVPIAMILPVILYFHDLVMFSFAAGLLLAIGRYVHSEALKKTSEPQGRRRLGMRMTVYSHYVSIAGVIFYIVQKTFERGW